MDMSSHNCPMCPPSSKLDRDGFCASCSREWSERDGNLLSKPRRVMLSGFPAAGQRLDDFIKPISDEQPPKTQNPRLIGAKFDHYASRHIPRNASKTQYIETRRAFYAGVATLWGTVMSLLDPGEEATDADLALCQSIDDELQEFLSDVEKGKT